MADSTAGSLGVPNLPIRRDYLRAALDMMYLGAERLRVKRLVTSVMHEDTISNYLNVEMHDVQRSGGSDIIWWNIRVDHQFDPFDPTKICELDFKFQWSDYSVDYRNERYLAAEAKRLRGKGQSLSGDYIDDGLMDFVVGKYGRGHDYGIMVGYVTVSPLSRAIASVRTAMVRRTQMTQEVAPLGSGAGYCDHPFTFSSVHKQNNATLPITIIHLFFDFT